MPFLKLFMPQTHTVSGFRFGPDLPTTTNDDIGNSDNSNNSNQAVGAARAASAA